MSSRPRPRSTLATGLMVLAMVPCIAVARDPGVNQPGAIGNPRADPGLNQPGAVGNVGVGAPGVAGPGVGAPGVGVADPGLNQPGIAGNVGGVARRTVRR